MMEITDLVEVEGTIGLTVDEADRLVALHLAANEKACAGLETLLPLDQVVALIRAAHERMYSEGGSWRIEVPRPLPPWIDEKDVFRTISVWSPMYPKPVTGREAIEMMQDVARLGSLLAKHGGGKDQ